MLLKEFVRLGANALKGVYSEKEAERVIEIVCAHFLGVQSYTHIIEPGYEIKEQNLAILDSVLERLKSGEPVQYVTGVAPFGEYEFAVTPAVLIPRPETEMLVREAEKVATRIQRMRIPFGENASPVRILDLCTGSGCIAWTMALDVPGVKVTAVDISEEALSIASSQPFFQLIREKRACTPVFEKADILDLETTFEEDEYDIIVSNPPYIMCSQKSDMKANVLDFEPSIALFAPEEDPLAFYRAIAARALRHLAANGHVLVEINDELGKSTAQIFRDSGFREVTLIKDFYDRDRIVSSIK